MSGFALKITGYVVKVGAMALAPVVAVLAWGAVEQERDKRRNKTATAGTGP